MKDNFHNDFERYLRENSDKYRMYPSEKVWKGIETQLHHKPWKYGVALTLILFITGALVAFVMWKYPTPTEEELLAVAATQKEKVVPIIEEEPAQPVVMLSSNTHLKKDPTFFHEKIKNSVAISSINHTPVTAISEPILTEENIAKSSVIPQKMEVKNKSSVRESIAINHLAALLVPEELLDKEIDLEPEVNGVITSSSFANLNLASEEALTAAIGKNAKINKKTQWQYYVAPTISYRKLSDNKSFIIEANNSGTLNPDVYKDVEQVVVHRPDLGLELGVSAKRQLTERFTLKAGAQFNISRYHIKAYSFVNELATINLDQQFGNNTISKASQYRTKFGSKINWLENLYYSASFPIGAELRLSDDRKNYWTLGATVQPTVVLSNRAYLLSTDFKNYMEVPNLIRRVNVNAGIELVKTIEGPKTTWQIGPQLRYQMQSSFVKKYPVKENLFDFGIKVGFSINR